jgi:hypothetical protein
MIKANERSKPWLAGLVLIIATFAIYWPVRHHDFVLYDDPEYVSENATVQAGITTYGLMWTFVDAHVANWHPITWISHMIDCQLFGMNPGAHHLVNVAFHCANTALLFVLLRTTTGALWRSAFVAAVFAWHPLRVESVAWISERKDVLSGFFFMLTLLAYARYAKTRALYSNIPSPSQVPGPSWRFSIFNSQFSIFSCGKSAFCFPFSGRQFYFLSLVFFTLGLLSKAMLVTMPFILLLLDLWPLNRIDHETTASRVCGIPKPLLLEKIPFVLLSLVVGVLNFLAQTSSGAVVSLKSEGLSERIATALLGYFQYLGKILWPRDLAVLYLRPPGVVIPVVASAIVVLFIISAVVFLNVKPRPYLAFGWLWFLGILLPVNGLIQLSLQSIADRYTYLSAVGLTIMLVWGLDELRSTLAPGRAAQGIFLAMGLTVLMACAALARRQIAYWQNTETLMEHALRLNPGNYVAHQNLAVYYSSLGLTRAARQHRQRFRELEALAQLAEHSAPRAGVDSLRKEPPINE